MNTRPLTQGSPAWHAWRDGEVRDGRRTGGGLGGSDIASVLGISPYPDATRESVFAAKVHGVEREANFAMRRGTRWERHARAAYSAHVGRPAPPVCCEMAEMPWARVSLDGLPRLADGPRVLELKCPNYLVHGAALEGVVPEHFAVQIQWQLFVTGLEWCDFASFNPGEKFTPPDWPLMAPWRLACRKWLAKPKCDRGPRPELLDLWLERPPAERPPMPPEWLAVTEVRADPDRQAEILAEAGRFWMEVLEARAARAELSTKGAGIA